MTKDGVDYKEDYPEKQEQYDKMTYLCFWHQNNLNVDLSNGVKCHKQNEEL